MNARAARVRPSRAVSDSPRAFARECAEVIQQNGATCMELFFLVREQSRPCHTLKKDAKCQDALRFLLPLAAFVEEWRPPFFERLL